MPRNDPGASPTGTRPSHAYGRDAARYDARTAGFDVYRRRVIDLLPLSVGDVVVDVGCGTGLCFERLLEKVGPGGTVIGVEPAAPMQALAAERIAAGGWANVILIGAPIETAELPTVDHALFCAVHDVLQSPAALDSVLAHVRDGGGVAATGGKWAPPWAVLVNAAVLAAHAPFVRDFTGFSRPWEPLASRVPGLSVTEVAWGGGFLAWGTVRHRKGAAPQA